MPSPSCLWVCCLGTSGRWNECRESLLQVNEEGNEVNSKSGHGDFRAYNPCVPSPSPQTWIRDEAGMQRVFSFVPAALNSAWHFALFSWGVKLSVPCVGSSPVHTDVCSPCFNLVEITLLFSLGLTPHCPPSEKSIMHQDSGQSSKSKSQTMGCWWDESVHCGAA